MEKLQELVLIHHIKVKIQSIILFFFLTSLIFELNAQIPVTNIKQLDKVIIEKNIKEEVEKRFFNKLHVVYLFKEKYLFVSNFSRKWRFSSYPPLKGKVCVMDLESGNEYVFQLKKGIRNIDSFDEKNGVIIIQGQIFNIKSKD